MIDQWGRNIHYLRVSITDRCNMRCRYCMPCGMPEIEHSEILRYEEILRICKAAAAQGITCYKITGGEPLVRKGAIPFIAALKQLDGVHNVTITTNGYFLEDALPALQEAGIDGINVSLDTLDPRQFRNITGVDSSSRVMSAIEASVKAGIRTKINSVLLNDTKDQIIPLANLAERLPVDIRFIELMPIGYGKKLSCMPADDALQLLQEAYADLQAVDEKRGNGPAMYFKSSKLLGRIGVIAANSHKFCQQCNRMRLTSTGLLKPCLCYDDSIELKPLLRSDNGHVDEALRHAFVEAVHRKPSGHCFGDVNKITENKFMSQIGG